MSWTVCKGLAAAAVLVAAGAGAGAGALTGCGGSADKARAEDHAQAQAAPAASDEDAEAAGDADDDDGLEVQGIKGHLDPSDIQAGVAPVQGKLARCYQSQQRHRRYLTGMIKLRFDVGPDGSVSQAQVVDSSLGSWPVEKCVLAIARELHFARPRGGDHKADFTVPLDFQAGRGRVVWWDEVKVDAEVSQHKAELDSCAGDSTSPQGVTVTFYIGNRGQVKAVGFASTGSAPVEDAWADCAADIVAGWTMPDPLGVIAKTAFQYN